MNYNPNMFEVGDKVMAKIYGLDYADPEVEYEGVVTIREIHNGYIYFHETIWNTHPAFDFVRHLTKLEKALK
jgi:hypothetical protein